MAQQERPEDTGVSNAALLAGDWQRHKKALGAALDQAQLLQQQLERTHLLSSGSVRDRVAVRILQGDPAGQPAAAAVGQQSPARRRPAAAVLLEAARLQHTEAHADELTALASEVAALRVTAAALDTDEANLRRRFLPKPRSLAAVITDNERLAGLSEAQILTEVRTQAAEGAKRARLLGLRSQIATAHRETQQSISSAAAAVSGHRPGSHASSQQHSQCGSSEDEDEDDDNDDCSGDADADSLCCPEDLGGEASQSEVQPQLLAPPEDLPGMLAIIKGQRQCGRRNPIPLEAVAASLVRDLPQQQEQLALLKRVSACTSARLHASAGCRSLSSYAGQLALTAQQRSIRGLAQELVDELIASALAHVAMRPSRAVVDLELAEWGVGQPAALAAISRHITDGLYKDVVDELLAEVAAEVLTSAAAADAFSSDMLVAAVASSTGKFDLGFSAGQAPHKRGVVGVAREAALLCKVASSKSTAILTGVGVEPPTSSTHSATSSSSSSSKSFGGLKPLPLPDSSRAGLSESVYLARRDFSALDNAFSSAAAPDASLLGPSGSIKAGSTTAASSQQQHQQSGRSKYARGLYLSGLRGMLAEMQAVRPPGTPYGHTQQLTARLNPARGKAARLAVSRARPPLAACGRVWVLRQGPLGRLEAGSWAGQHHMAAAAKERAYWSRVAVRGYLMVPAPKTASPTAPPVSSCTVPPALGAISCVCASPAGHLLAVGTDKGAVLVWDVSADTPAGPVFQVSGLGAVYKHSAWWKPWQDSQQQQPAITGLAWSADGFQLASLDAGSNLKLWWITPERQGPGEPPPPAGVPPAPQLAVLVTPHNVAVSGKAPISDDDGAAMLAAQESVLGPAAAAAAGGSSAGKGGVLPKLGQLLGLSGPNDSRAHTQQAAAAAAAAGELSAGSGMPSHVCHPVFHPARTAAGTQPTLVIPQVTGDVLSLTTAVAEAAVQPGPAPTASQAAVGAAMASGLTAASRGAAAGSTATGRGQVPAGAVLAGTPSTAAAAAAAAVGGLAAAPRAASGAAAAAAGSSKAGAGSSSSVGGPNFHRSSSVAAAGRSSVGASGSGPALQQQQQQSSAGAMLPQAVVDYLMPPQQVNTDIERQALYRAHSSPLVFLGFLSDDASLVSLDASGLLALWPASPDMQRSGFGWIKPRARWQLPRMMRTCQLRGGIQPFFPTPGSRQLPAPATSSSSSSNNNTNSSSWYVRYVPDEQDASDAVRLRGDPSGEFLLRSRTPWLVRYLPQPAARQQRGDASIIRQVFHRPPDEAELPSTAAGTSSSSSSKSVVVSSYDAATGALLSRAKQRCTFTKAPVKVVGAQLTPSKRELLVLARTSPAPDDASALATLTAHTLDLRTMRGVVPRIDLPDVSGGASGAPAFALTAALVATGSEYLLADLGCGAVGVCSLATGQLVREVRLHSMVAPAAGGARVVLSGLQWMRVRVGGGAGREGRTLLAAACVGGQALCLVQLDTDAAAQQLKAEQEQHGGAQPPGESHHAVGQQRQSGVYQQQPVQQQQQQREPGPVPAQQQQPAWQGASRPPPSAGRSSTQRVDAAAGGRRSSVRFVDSQQQQQQMDNG